MWRIGSSLVVPFISVRKRESVRRITATFDFFPLKKGTHFHLRFRFCFGTQNESSLVDETEMKKGIWRPTSCSPWFFLFCTFRREMKSLHHGALCFMSFTTNSFHQFLVSFFLQALRGCSTGNGLLASTLTRPLCQIPSQNQLNESVGCVLMRLMQIIIFFYCRWS